MGLLFCRTRPSFQTSFTKQINTFITVEQWSFARREELKCVLNTKTICEEANKTGFTAGAFILKLVSWILESVVCFQLLATVENVEELVVIVTVSINDKPAVQSHNGAIVVTGDRSSSHVLVQEQQLWTNVLLCVSIDILDKKVRQFSLVTKCLWKPYELIYLQLQSKRSSKSGYVNHVGNWKVNERYYDDTTFLQ